MCYIINCGVKGLPLDTFSNARWACPTFHSSKLPSYCYFCQFNTPEANLQAWQSNTIMRGVRERERESETARLTKRKGEWRTYNDFKMPVRVHLCVHLRFHLSIKALILRSLTCHLGNKEATYIKKIHARGRPWWCAVRDGEGEKRSVLCRCVPLPRTST